MTVPDKKQPNSPGATTLGSPPSGQSGLAPSTENPPPNSAACAPVTQGIGPTGPNPPAVSLIGASSVMASSIADATQTSGQIVTKDDTQVPHPIPLSSLNDGTDLVLPCVAQSVKRKNFTAQYDKQNLSQVDQSAKSELGFESSSDKVETDGSNQNEYSESKLFASQADDGHSKSSAFTKPTTGNQLQVSDANDYHESWDCPILTPNAKMVECFLYNVTKKQLSVYTFIYNNRVIYSINCERNELLQKDSSIEASSKWVFGPDNFEGAKDYMKANYGKIYPKSGSGPAGSSSTTPPSSPSPTGNGSQGTALEPNSNGPTSSSMPTLFYPQQLTPPSTPSMAGSGSGRRSRGPYGRIPTFSLFPSEDPYGGLTSGKSSGQRNVQVGPPGYQGSYSPGSQTLFSAFGPSYPPGIPQSCYRPASGSSCSWSRGPRQIQDLQIGCPEEDNSGPGSNSRVMPQAMYSGGSHSGESRGPRQPFGGSGFGSSGSGGGGGPNTALDPFAFISGPINWQDHPLAVNFASLVRSYLNRNGYHDGVREPNYGARKSYRSSAGRWNSAGSRGVSAGYPQAGPQGGTPPSPYPPPYY